MDNNNWLQELKVGDLIWVRFGCIRVYHYESHQIVRATISQVMIAHLHYPKFRRANGWYVGGGWEGPRLIEPTAKNLIMIQSANAIYRRKLLISKLTSESFWKDASLGLLEEIEEMVAAIEREKVKNVEVDESGEADSAACVCQ